MTSLTHDTPATRTSRSGLVFAVASAVTFGMSGALARPMLDAGWSAGAVVLLRIGIGALAILPFGIRALRGQWGLVVRHWRVLATYGLIPIAFTQFAYFSAVASMPVGPALLIEYTAPAVIVVWLWLRHGQRPGPLTLAGAGVCAVGLVLVLDLLSGADLRLTGTLWALGAMLGAAFYFIMSADQSTGVPPMSLAAGGLLAGTVVLGLAGVLGVLPMRFVATDVAYAGIEVALWVPLVLLGLVTAAIAYATGIAANRRLGSRLASFVALSEVVAGALWAWLLLGQLPGALQLVGGVLILIGVIGVKLGERQVSGG